MDKAALEDLDMLLEEALGDPDALQQHERLIALAGKSVVDQLVDDVKQVLAITGGDQSFGNEQFTLHVLRARVLRNQNAAMQLASAYDTLEYEAIAEEEYLFDSD